MLRLILLARFKLFKSYLSKSKSDYSSEKNLKRDQKNKWENKSHYAVVKKS